MHGQIDVAGVVAIECVARADAKANAGRLQFMQSINRVLWYHFLLSVLLLFSE